jgi:hypothetical protein
MKHPTPKDVHQNAASLIIAAAIKSGFLDEVAQALCANSKYPASDCPVCLQCMLVEELVAVFNDNIVLPENMLDCLWEVYTPERFPEEIVAPFRGIETPTPAVKTPTRLN